MAHHHPPQLERINYNKRFLFGIGLNTFLVIAQVYYGIQSNSVALVSDGFHNAGDVLGLFIAWGGFHIASLKASEKFTYGLKNTTIIAAFINAVLLFIAVGGIAWEAILRLHQPPMIQTKTVIVVALMGVMVNGLTAILFASGRQDINIRGAFLHMLSDVAISIGVILGSALILITSWTWIDPGLCLVISLLIVLSTWSLFKESINLILHAAPEHIRIEEVRDYLLKQKGVISLHDLHIWAISTSETALSVHVIVGERGTEDETLTKLANGLLNQFQIHHVTIQIESKMIACDVSC